MSRTYQIFGGTGTGKTTLALGAKGRKWYGEFDPGSFERASIGLRLNEGEIDLHQYQLPLTTLEDMGTLDFSMVGQSGKGAVQIVHRYQGWTELYYGRFVPDFLAALKDPSFTTLIIDTSTLLWVVAQNALRQRIQDEPGTTEYKTDRLKRLEYEEPNSNFTSIVQGCKQYGKDLILIAHRGEIYFNDKPTGKWKPDGWGKAMDGSDISVMLEVVNRQPVATVYKAGIGGLELLDRRIENPTMEKIDGLVDGAAKLRGLGFELPQDNEELIALAEAM